MTDAPKPDDTKPSGPVWLDRHLWEIQPIRDLLMLASIIGVVWFGYKASVVTVPLLLAITLAYLVEPLIRALGRFGIRRRFASVGIIVGTVGLIGVPSVIGGGVAIIQGKDLVVAISEQASAVVTSVEAPEDERLRELVPEGPWRELRDVIVDLQTPAPAEPEPTEPTEPEPTEPEPESTEPGTQLEQADQDASSQSAEDVAAASDEGDAEESSDPVRFALPAPAARSQIGSLMAASIGWARDNAQALAQRAAVVGADALDAAVATLGGLIAVSFSLFLTMFFFFFICNAWGKLRGTFDQFIPDEYEQRVHDLLAKFDRVIAGFVRGRLIIAMLQSVIFTLGYWIIGVPAPLILGPVVAVLSIVPYLAIVGIPVSIVLLYLEPNGGFMDAWWWTLIAPVVVYNLGQALDDYVWTPMIQGKETGLGTASILFATFAGGAIMGFYGLLLAIPLAACLKILFDDVVMPAIAAWGRGEKPDFLPFAGKK